MANSEKETLRSEFSRFVEECPTATSILGVGALAVSLFGGYGLADKISDPTIGALACGALTATGAGIAALSLNLPFKKANVLFISAVACAGGAFGFLETFSNSSNTIVSTQQAVCGNKKEGQEAHVVCALQ